ncbi:hemerythrin superfamily protein [Oxalobacteraceae bacterium GrIS 2.11]
MTIEISKPAKATKSPKPQEAIAILRADHKMVSGLFDDYEKATTKATKKKLVSQICTALSVHAQVEEEIFYPAVKKATKDHLMVPEATVEHATLKSLIAQVEGIEPDGDMYDAKIKVLCEYVQHHVKEEQNLMFPKAKASKLDMLELGEQIATRKQELLALRA